LPAIAAEEKVRNLPTFLLYKEGVRVYEVIGPNEILLLEAIKKHLR